MKLKNTRNVIHLAITRNTALHVVIYIDNEKIDWYNESGIHSLVLDALYPVIVENLVTHQGHSLSKRETNRIIELDACRLLYRFTPRTSQQALIKMEKEVVKTNYKSLSIYPFQLLISIDNEFINNTIDSYLL